MGVRTRIRIVALAWAFAAGVVAAPAAVKAPAFTLEDQNGNKVSLSDFADKFVVLEWTNWDCPFVKRHLRAKTAQAVLEKFKDKGVVWVKINSTQYCDTAANKKRAAASGVTHPVLNDQSGKVGHAYGARTTPDIRIINKNGSVAYAGAIDNDLRGRKTDGKVNYVEKALEELLAGKAVSTPKTRPYGCSVKYAK